MFELVAAIAVMGVALVAIFGLATRSVSNTTESRSASEANRLSQEAIEWLRRERDDDWDVFLAKTGPWCLVSLDWSRGGACGAGQIVTGTIYTREVELRRIDSSNVEAIVVTSWSDQSGGNQSRITAVYTNWRTN